MPARADSVNAEGDSDRGADDDGVEDGDVVGRGDEREVEDDGDQNMRSTEDADDADVSAPPSSHLVLRGISGSASRAFFCLHLRTHHPHV